MNKIDIAKKAINKIVKFQITQNKGGRGTRVG